MKEPIDIPQLKNAYKNLHLPEYGDSCIFHIPGHIKYLHGVNNESSLKGDISPKEATKTVLFTMDGFGHKQWREHQNNNPVLKRFAQDGTVKTITSMFPSSTVPSITALSTGLCTQQHGLLEWWIYDHASDQIVTALPFTTLGVNIRESLSGELDKSFLINSPTLFSDLSKEGVRSFSLIDGEFAHSTYSKLAYGGSNILTHSTVDELFTNLQSALLEGGPSHINVYWDKIDSAGHAHGPDSAEYAEQVKIFFDALDNFLRSVDKSIDTESVAMLITADHGQIAIDPQKTVWLDELLNLDQYLETSADGKTIEPWGLQRDVYLQIKEDVLDEAVRELQSKIGDRAVVLKSQDAMHAGLFGQGKPHPDFTKRIGNVVIIAQGEYSVWYRHYPEETFKYNGMHGGLTEDEVKIAFAESKMSNLIP